MFEMLLLVFGAGIVAGVMIAAVITLVLPKPEMLSDDTIAVIADKAHHRAIAASQLGTAQMLKAMGEMRDGIKDDLRFVTGRQS